MENPFEKRAHEHLRDTEAFLSIISPDPVRYYLERAGKDGRLYDRRVVILGTPGSGKTTLAKLFEFPSLHAVTRRQDGLYKELAKSLHECESLSENKPRVLGCRLPMESDYRAFWELAYPDGLRFGLMTALVQARAVLGWLRSLEVSGYPLEDVKAIPRPEEEGAIDTIGGETAIGLRDRARRVEEAIYSAVNSLVPPPVEHLSDDATSAYRPFDVIDTIRLDKLGDLRPLVVFDDVHNLHPDQHEMFRRWLARRELKISRWMLTRLDSVPSRSLFKLLSRRDLSGAELPGITAARDFEVIWLHSQDRRNDRPRFRKLARDISGRYLQRMSVFRDRRIRSIADLLEADRKSLSPKETERLGERVAKLMHDLGIPESTQREIERDSAEAVAERGGGEDLRLAVSAIAAHSWSKRQPQGSLFGEEDLRETKPRALNAAVVHGAALHLHHQYGLPLYFGFDTLADAASENIEQFLRLASVLVEDAMTKIIRGRPSAAIDVSTQDKLLRERATAIIRDWNFPMHRDVRKLLDRLAKIMLERSLEPNAPLGSGANAYGVEQEQIDRGLVDHPDLQEVFRFGQAYNAFGLVPNYPQGQKEWFLIELGGIPCLRFGLTLKRGGFVEGNLSDLAGMLENGS